MTGRRALALLSIGLIGACTLIAISFPFLAVNAPIHARTAVVEGWIPSERIPAVAAALDSLGYERIYVTGTIRPCSYTLRIRDTLVIETWTPMLGELAIEACGSTGSGMLVLTASGTLLHSPLSPECGSSTITLPGSCDKIMITPTFDGLPQADWELLYLASVHVAGKNLHELQRSVRIHGQEGRSHPGTPTYADLAANALEQAGISKEALIRLRTLHPGESRTWSNAKLFALRAMRDGLKEVDIISYGIHARRSRETYRIASSGRIRFGVISIPDPEVAPGRWWRSWQGWVKVCKELAGIPASYFVDRLPH